LARASSHLGKVGFIFAHSRTSAFNNSRTKRCCYTQHITYNYR